MILMEIQKTLGLNKIFDQKTISLVSKMTKVKMYLLNVKYMPVFVNHTKRFTVTGL